MASKKSDQKINITSMGELRKDVWKRENKNIAELMVEHRDFSFALECAFKIIQNMPGDVRKPFLRACEEIK